jgi:DNA-binding transcriptional MerR regulator
MLRIGEFSRLSQVTVKTLRHYDEIGLLKPSHIDPFSDYRYYTLDQLPRLHSIMALKSMGLSLEEIARLLIEDLPPEQIRGMFRLKQAEARRSLQEEQARLAQIEFRLRQIEMAGSMQSVDIVIKRIDPFYALTLRRIAHNRQERQVVAEPIAQAIQRGAIKPGGAARLNIFYEDEFRGEYDDYELCIPVPATHSPQALLAGVGTLQLRELPAIEAAATYLHQGDYDTLNEKYVFLQRWAVENGYKLGGTWRFVWHRGPMHDVDPSEYLTELQHPIEPA